MPRARLHFGAIASVTVTSWSFTSPVFVTLIVQFALPPLATVWRSGVFVIWISGFVLTTSGAGGGGGGGGVGFGAGTVTCAESLAVTSGPVGGVPMSVATFVKLWVTFCREQV